MSSPPDEPAASMDVLTSDECYRLLGTQEFGRLGVNAEEHPLIFPVNYGLDGTTIVIRTGPGTKLAAAERANVAFEVDQVDPRTRSGWSVLVRGHAERLAGTHGGEVVLRTLAHGVQPWAPGDYGVWLLLIPQAISGRRIVPGELPPAIDPRAYL
jgi:nitroimidazol reductase NimA-like FMN-containing flavoprotein (pyridoxamine 5'-phosphate oxidase superfamily)